jgi:hypothetical protein
MAFIVDTKPGYFQRFAPFSLAREDNANITRLIAVSHVEKYRGRDSLFPGVFRDKTGYHRGYCVLALGRSLKIGEKKPNKTGWS